MPRSDVALDKYGIYRISSLGRAPHCPEAVRKVCQLVYDSKDLRIDHFVARPEGSDSRSVYDTNAAHDYDMKLGSRACELADRCGDPDMMDSPEVKWVLLLSQRVFLLFDRQLEEKLDDNRPFHHWYATYMSTADRLMHFKSCLPPPLPTKEPANN